MNHRIRGFTLIEVLVVIIIIAVLASTVALNFLGADREQNLRTEAERLTALIELARIQALSRNEEWGVAVAADGYSFMIYEPQRNRWVAEEGSPFRPRVVPDVGLAVKVDAVAVPDHEDNSARPAILILSSGEQTPFEIELIPTWETRSWIVKSDGLSRTEALRAP